VVAVTTAPPLRRSWNQGDAATGGFELLRQQDAAARKGI
jgi:hypothetical protein